MKTCSKCKEEKDFKYFPKNKAAKDGYNWYCKECSNKVRKEKGYSKVSGANRKKKYAEDKEYREKIKKAKRISSRKNYKSRMLNNAKRRANKKGLSFNLTENDLILPKICPILKVPFITGTKGNYEYTPSIDRIDNSKGYTKDNIQIITNKANSMKNSASLQELISFRDWIDTQIN